MQVARWSWRASKYAVSVGIVLKSRPFVFTGPRFLCNKASLPILTLYTKHVCPLCDEAKAALESCRHRFQMEEVDITKEGNEAWFEKYRYEIPVFHLNGSFLMKHRVNEELLEKELTKYEHKQDAVHEGTQ